MNIGSSRKTCSVISIAGSFEYDRNRCDLAATNCSETSLCTGVMFKLQIEGDLGNSRFLLVDLLSQYR